MTLVAAGVEAVAAGGGDLHVADLGSGSLVSQVMVVVVEGRGVILLVPVVVVLLVVQRVLVVVVVVAQVVGHQTRDRPREDVVDRVRGRPVQARRRGRGRRRRRRGTRDRRRRRGRLLAGAWRAS